MQDQNVSRSGVGWGSDPVQTGLIFSCGCGCRAGDASMVFIIKVLSLVTGFLKLFPRSHIQIPSHWQSACNVSLEARTSEVMDRRGEPPLPLH